MAYIGKSYKHNKNENFKEFLESLKIPDENIQPVLASSPTQKLERDGDNFTLVTIDARGTTEVNFKSGVELEENLRGYISKTKFTVDGNVMIQEQNFSAQGIVITYKREYSEDRLVVSVSTNNWEGPALRYYDVV